MALPVVLEYDPSPLSAVSATLCSDLCSGSGDHTLCVSGIYPGGAGTHGTDLDLWGKGLAGICHVGSFRSPDLSIFCLYPCHCIASGQYQAAFGR